MLVCHRCKQRAASRTLYGPKGSQIFLCDDCAAQEASATVVQKMLLPVLMGPLKMTPTACPSCGTTILQIHESSLLGCSECYRHFREAVLVTIQRMQGSIQHKPRGGDPPKALPPDSSQDPVQVSDLQKQLDESVAEERYEDAARLRDRIRAIEAGGAL